jgi:hypothetical protein
MSLKALIVETLPRVGIGGASYKGVFAMFIKAFTNRLNAKLCWHLAALGTTFLFLLALITPAAAQNIPTGVPEAGSGPAFDFSAGYTYLTMPVTSTNTANLNGLDAASGIDFLHHWGAIADASYVRASNVLGMGHGSYVMTFLVGPVFYPVERHSFRLSLRGLVGAGLVDSIVPVNSTTNLHGWVARPSYGGGAGIEHSIYGPFGVRVNGDYLRTAFVNAADAVQAQNNLRLTVSLVFHVRDRL